MKNEIEAMITDITTTTAEAEDYTGEDGLLYCGKCHTPKEAYFSKETAQWLGHDRHPTDCDCQRAAREKQQAAESRQKHLEKVEDLKRRGFTDPAMRNWTFEHDNGRNPQTETARFYVESWETMQAENIGYLFWGGVGTGKSYLAACIANALMEKEVAVRMTNFATILNDLAASFEGRNEYISRLCSYPLLILDDFGMQSMLIGFTMTALNIIIFVLVYGRMLEIYMLTSLAPIPVATLSNREVGQMGQNYLKSLFAVGFQGLLILLCVGIYGVLVQGISTSGDPIGAIWGCVGYTVLLCFMLFKTGSISKSIFGAH